MYCYVFVLLEGIYVYISKNFLCFICNCGVYFIKNIYVNFCDFVLFFNFYRIGFGILLVNWILLVWRC